MNLEDTAIGRAIRVAGGQVELAHALTDLLPSGAKLTQQSVSLWYQKGYVPRKRWELVERATRGRITAAEMEADYSLYGPQ